MRNGPASCTRICCAPRAPYVRALPGIPTIRVFEALACGIPLVCAPWDDCEGLFTPGADYLVARTGAQMRDHLTTLLCDRSAAAAMAARGPNTVIARHTCTRRVDELLGIQARLQSGRPEGYRPAHRPHNDQGPGCWPNNVGAPGP